MKPCNRLDKIPPYIFADLDRLRKDMIQKGMEIIDISIGDPDLPTPSFIIDALYEGMKNVNNYRYPPYEGTYEFRKSVADYYKRRFGVELDPEDEVVALIGSKEGIAHLCLALIDRDDTAFVPEPAYPIYKTSVCMAGGIPHTITLFEDSGFLPDLSCINNDAAKRAKLVFFNYPNNPTGAVCDAGTYKSIIEFALENDIIVCSDAAYNELVFDKLTPLSILSISDSKRVAVEFGTLSKSYNMTGWRIGYAVGSREILRKLMIVKSNTDSGQFGAIQHAACAALDKGDGYIDYIRNVYENRRNNALNRLKSAGFETFDSKGSFYIWFKVPDLLTSHEYVSRVVKECGVIITPGSAFGPSGEGYCRIALTVDNNIFDKAIERISSSGLSV